MRGMPSCNFPAFARYTAMLRERGHEVLSPAELDLQSGFDPEVPRSEVDIAFFMARDLPHVCQSEAVAVMPGWELSQGANIEVVVARMVGKKVVDADTLDEIPPDADYEALTTVRKIITLGRQKHASESWRTEDQDNHLDKSLRHSLTYKLQRDGNSPKDSEDHLSLALCRLAFAFWQDRQKKAVASV